MARDRRPSFRSHRRRVRSSRSFSEWAAGQSVERAAPGLDVVGVRNRIGERIAQAGRLLGGRRGGLADFGTDLGNPGDGLFEILRNLRRDTAPYRIFVGILEHL